MQPNKRQRIDRSTFNIVSYLFCSLDCPPRIVTSLANCSPTLFIPTFIAMLQKDYIRKLLFAQPNNTNLMSKEESVTTEVVRDKSLVIENESHSCTSVRFGDHGNAFVVGVYSPNKQFPLDAEVRIELNVKDPYPKFFISPTIVGYSENCGLKQYLPLPQLSLHFQSIFESQFQEAFQ